MSFVKPYCLSRELEEKTPTTILQKVGFSSIQRLIEPVLQRNTDHAILWVINAAMEIAAIQYHREGSMNCTVGGGPKRALVVVRDLSLSRLGNEGLATAYEIVVPVFYHRPVGSPLSRIEQVQQVCTVKGVGG